MARQQQQDKYCNSESVRVVEARSTLKQDSSDERDRELKSLRQQHMHA